MAKGFASRPGDYQGYPLTVDGTVDSVEPGGDTVILAGYKDDAGKVFNITCLVGTSGEADAKKLAKGSHVIVKGQCMGSSSTGLVNLATAVIQE